ncbi:uncharacterized protein LOC120067978 isoform X2 [Benincasa hispida]|uniref:uncharacterized protein LOC120067978 isoform X2 n=1 Tax=Benincasa hispida TaxID=102211 RepID=UPI0019028962|nr:uncharacterized protein LOC120067978 isoform X2 [Benincasa hispida]
MFTIRVDRVNDLRLALLPMATLCDAADIKCTNRNLSIIVLPTRYSFVAALRLLPSFFTSFQFHPVGEFNAYRANFYLKLFTTNISNMYSDDLSVTLLLNRHNALAPVKFEDPHSGYLQYSALLLARPHNVDINPIDLRVFFAIRSAEFINTLSDLVVLPTEYVCVVVTKTGALFKSARREIVFSTEDFLYGKSLPSFRALCLREVLRKFQIEVQNKGKERKEVVCWSQLLWI